MRMIDKRMINSTMIIDSYFGHRNYACVSIDYVIIVSCRSSE